MEKRRLDYSHRKTINRFTRKYLAGAELVNDTEDKLILQVLFDYSEQTAEHFLKRMLSITSSMIKDSVLSFESMDKELAKHVVLKGDEVERLKLLAKRQLNTLGTHDMKAIELAQFIKIIEKIGDQACRIANETIVASQESFDQANTITIKKMGDFAQNLVDEVSLSLLKEDYKSAEESIRKTQEFLELEKELICSFKKDLAISSCEVSVVSVALLLHEIVCLAKDLPDFVEFKQNTSKISYESAVLYIRSPRIIGHNSISESMKEGFCFSFLKSNFGSLLATIESLVP